MEEKKLQIKAARRDMNRLGAVMIVYYLLMNAAVSAIMLADLSIYLFGALKNGMSVGINDILSRITEFATSNGWGYLLAILAGAVIVLFWKGKDFFVKDIFHRQKKMTPGVFLMLLCFFIAPQGLLQVYATAFEWLLNQIGFSATAALEMATITTDKLSMFLYISLLGPISEELLFRGVVLRLLRPYGKQAAVMISAIVFGLFHGNVIQIPFAFLVGLVLGYVTVEYSIVWAMVLHVFNNFVLSDLMGRLTEVQPETASLLMFALLLLSVIAAVVMLIVEKEEVKNYFRENKVGAITWKGLFSSPVMWIFTVMMLSSALLTITKI